MPATVTIPRDVPAGSVIASGSKSYTFDNSNPVGVHCDNATTAVFTNYMGGASVGNVTPIGTTGLGYIVIGANTYVTGTKALPATAFQPPNCPSTGGNTCYLYLGPTVTVQLVKMQPIISNQIVPGGQYMSATVGGIPDMMVSLANAIQIINQSCTVTSTSLTVPLGSVPTRQFAGTGTSKEVPFNISVNCSGVPTNVGITFTDNANPGNTSTTLSLSAGSTASGVGIQILRNGTPIGFGPDSSIAANPNQVMIGPSNSSSAMSIPFSGRYVQTAASITPGTADGVATFTMSYQ